MVDHHRATLYSYLPMFELLATDSGARAGRLSLKHGVVETPIFMPVATTGAIKSLLPVDLENMGAQIILANTYHMYLRPGPDLIGEFGGLHSFMGWSRPILTDSGGFQIWSLSKFRKIEESGATFKSHLDGRELSLSPEEAVQIQETLGSDIHMVLDECTPFPVSYETARDSMLRSMRWAKRCRQARSKQDLLQFGIVQGSIFEDLRRESVAHLVEIGFDGYAVGGLSVGESKPELQRVCSFVANLLPPDKARYLMGVGTPLDIIEGVANGVDMFDCVLPARNARRGTLYTSQGKVSIKNQKFRGSKEPLDPLCSCPTCKNFPLAFLSHMFRANEPTSYRLLTTHNLHYFLSLTREIRQSIFDGRFAALLEHHRRLWKP